MIESKKQEAKKYLKIFIWPPIVFGLHVLATYFGWYWMLPWFDIPMHLLGGASIALMVYFALQETEPLPLWTTLALMIAGGAMAAIGWEWFEFIIDHFFNTVTQLGLFDTLKDLYDGITGATSVALIIMFRAMRKK